MSEFDYDLFISHASGDKEAFVRPLVDALTAEHLSVWYDEAELKPGDRLVSSIERGLARSRFGLIVLSPAFFERRWPRSELDALTGREFATGESVLLPVWLNVDSEEVRRYSLLLADRVAIIASRGVDYTVSRIVEVVRPGRSPITLCRELLRDRGVATPPPSDSWWLSQIESAAELEGEGGFQSAMLWDRWGFPLPPRDEDPARRAGRLAQAVMRNAWVAEADRRPITQITRPEEVHGFIEEMPGLRDTCFEHPSYLGAYAPQLLIRGFGGAFEEIFDDWIAQERGKVRDTVGFHSADFATLDPASAACTFVQGELHGPSVQFYETADYFFWLLSAESEWLPDRVRETLVVGMADWGTWLNRATAFEREDPAEPLMSAAFTARERKEDFEMTPVARASLERLASESAALLGLPESGAILADRLVASNALEKLVRRNWADGDA